MIAGGNADPRTGGDHHLIGGELVARLGAQRVAAVGLGGAEPGVAGVHRHVGQAPLVRLAARRDRVDAAEHPRHDVGPAHLLDARVDAVTRTVPDGLGDLGGVDEHLGRDAADVEAGAAERALLADRDAHRLRSCGSTEGSGMLLPEPVPMIVRS